MAQSLTLHLCERGKADSSISEVELGVNIFQEGITDEPGCHVGLLYIGYTFGSLSKSTVAILGPVRCGAKVVSAGGNVKGTAAKGYGYRHARVARDYFHVN